MSKNRARRTRWSSIVTAVTVLLAGVTVLVTGPAPTASAAASPLVPLPADGITSDALPTAQIDGVAWSQAVVGNTVYAGGKFNNARPAGAAPGTNLTPRGNLLSYNLTTGVLNTSFAPMLNAQVLAVAASPDGSRIYVGGDFTTANGQPRSRVAAYSTSTGALISSFAPSVNSQVRALVATNDTVYVGGSFAGSGTTPRGNLAAFRASDGALTGWNPNADYIVSALALTEDGTAVIAGGSFQNVGGSPAYGLAKVNAVTGARLSWNATNTVRNAGADAGVTSLHVDGNKVYGTTYHFGPGGNLEGPFQADVTTGDVTWVVDCHGDTYSSYATGGVVYTVGHAHFCGNVGGGFPEFQPRTWVNAMAFTTEPTGTHLHEVFRYPNWGGFPSPSIVSWLPDTAIGSFTGQSQAGWSVAGNDDYVVLGGEFPRVNRVGQQGLVRFARRSMAPRAEGPKFPVGLTPTLVPTSATSVRVSWPPGVDRDDLALTYKLIRDGATATPIYTTTASSNLWTLPALGYKDTGLAPGSTHKYRVIANDPDGNTIYGGTASVTLPSTWTQTAYATRIIRDGASIYWPLNETSGTIAVDRAGVNDGVGGTGLTRGTAGAIAGDAATTFNGTVQGRISSTGNTVAPDEFTIQAWVKTTTSSGGRILGFSDLKTGSSGHRDRQIYMENSGLIRFGVRDEAGIRQTVSSVQSYRDGAWHQVTATLNSAGMQLYIDGIRVAQRAATTNAENYLGYWRAGGDAMGSWSGAPSNANFTGAIDEIAIYPAALSQGTIADQYTVSRGGTIPNLAPTAAFTSTTNGLRVDVDGSGSSDPDGSIVSYAWNFGDGGSATGATASRTYAAAGTYAVKLTVTDDKGATNSITKQVTVTASPAGVDFVVDEFGRTVASGWGNADVGGPWTAAASTFSVSNGAGRVSMASAGAGPSAFLNSVSQRDVSATMDVALDKVPTGGGTYTSLIVRRIGTSDYRLKLRNTATATTLQLTRMVSGTETALTTYDVPGLVYQVGDVLRLRLQVSGSGTTTLAAKVWKVGSVEPGTWMTTTTDNTADLQNPGAVGLRIYLSGSTTNAPVIGSVDNVRVGPIPQG